MPFQYTINEVLGVYIIHFAGELKIFDLADYTAFFDDFLKSGKVNLLLNLSSTSFIDSTAIGLLVNIKRSVEEKGGKLVLCEVMPEVMNVFRITGVDKFIDIFETEKEGLALFK
jgi:anti-anti-sigma factor